ncbi:hypothetical protein GALL_515070 [mine drainage metagenome]|uniref:Uncharacterized protein n=1 Tax=mine drainage metagenome TaxID=410659 RepID=A0A1J5P5W1_9ZZZZ
MSGRRDHARHIRSLWRRFTPPFVNLRVITLSVHAPGAAITSRQIGKLTGNLTKKHLLVRIPIHRVRDNVATEASECLDAGGRLAAPLLGHKNGTTAAKARSIGASNFSVEQPKAALATSEHDGMPLYSSIQPEYNQSLATNFYLELSALWPDCEA